MGSSKYNYEFEMAHTDNPYIDLLVYNTKLMAMNSFVKNEKVAISKETLRSHKNADKLLSAKAGVPIDKSFDPDEYVEINNYYRTLAGLPPFPEDDEIREWNELHSIDFKKEQIVDETHSFITSGYLEGIYEKKYIVLKDYKDLIKAKCPESIYKDIFGETESSPSNYKYLHQIRDITLINILENCGIVDAMKADHTGKDFEYLYHIGSKAVDPYVARTAENFTLLYCPTIEFEDLYNKFKRYFDRNRVFTITTIYSDAYAYGSDNYDDFIIMLIIIQTMIDMIVEVQEYIINKDIFDSRTIRYLFESYGIEYYKEIPIKYQLAIIKNVSMLLKYKSSNRNIIDICKLFGVSDIDISTYYLLKVKKVDTDKFEFIEDGDNKGLEDYSKNYELEFLKVPLMDNNIEKYMEDVSRRRGYDLITNQDPFWNGINDSDILSEQEKENYNALKKSKILEQDFTYLRTKYISIDAAVDITKLSYQISYLMSILFYKKEGMAPYSDCLVLDVDSHISESRRVLLTHMLCMMISLNYLYNGIEDDIIGTDIETNMIINGFNFESDWSTVYEELISLWNKGREENNEYKYLKGFSVDQLLTPITNDNDAIYTSAYNTSFLCGRYSDNDCYLWKNEFKEHWCIDIFEGYYPTETEGYQKIAYIENGRDGKSYPAYLRDDITYIDQNVVLYKVFEDPEKRLYKHCLDLSYKIGSGTTNADFINPSILLDNGSDIENFNRLKEIYTTNTNLYDHLTYMMKTTDDKVIYDIYKKIYDSFMQTKCSREFFRKPDSDEYYNTYTEYLSVNNKDLYAIITQARSYNNRDEQRTYISNICDYCIYALEKYFDSNEWKALYNIIPTHNVEFIQQCILKVIFFFKSWKTQTLMQTTSYIIDSDDDENGNRVHILEQVELTSHLNKNEKTSPFDLVGIKSINTLYESVSPTDHVVIRSYELIHQTTELDFIYSIEDGHVRLIRYISEYDNIRLPETIEDYPCEEIENGCFMTNVVKKCIIPQCYKIVN